VVRQFPPALRGHMDGDGCRKGRQQERREKCSSLATVFKTRPSRFPSVHRCADFCARTRPSPGWRPPGGGGEHCPITHTYLVGHAFAAIPGESPAPACSTHRRLDVRAAMGTSPHQFRAHLHDLGGPVSTGSRKARRVVCVGPAQGVVQFPANWETGMTDAI